MADTEAPTNEATTASIDETLYQSLNEDEAWFVSFVHQHYGIKGKLLELKEAVSNYGFTEQEFNDLIARPNIRTALQERGVIKQAVHRVKTAPVGKAEQPPEPEPKWAEHALTPMQLLVANTLLDLIDTRSTKKKLQDLGVTTTQYNTWLKDPVFQEYCRERAESLIGENQHEAMLALVDKVRMGDMNAIKYYHELMGRFTPASANNSGNSTSPDSIRNLLVSILEIIQDEVDDPQTALRISERFKGLINAHSMAGQMLSASENIELPEVAATRTLTPNLQKLVDGGEGYE